VADLPDGIKITWLGHATFVLDSPAGERILIDPWLAGNPSCPADMHDPGDIDTVLITHAHDDHMADAVTLAKSKSPQVVANNEIATWLGSKGVENATGMNIGGTFEVGSIKVHMTAARHSSSISDGDQSLYGGEAAGLVVEFENGFKVYHLGDTAIFGDLALIGKLLAPDIALVPIGDHYTMGPRSAAEAIRLLGVKHVIPMHYGTFPVLTGTPEDLKAETSDIDGLIITTLEPGGTLGG
jgi:L-ascorbate metabolism protein UlaG (beta-lactamase superfamily)